MMKMRTPGTLLRRSGEVRKERCRRTRLFVRDRGWGVGLRCRTWYRLLRWVRSGKFCLHRVFVHLFLVDDTGKTTDCAV